MSNNTYKMKIIVILTKSNSINHLITKTFLINHNNKNLQNNISSLNILSQESKFK